MFILKPEAGEYAPDASAYISLLPDDGMVLAHLENNCGNMLNFAQTLPAKKLTAAHAPNEWTVQDILAHVIDTERVFAYRALRIGRGDSSELPGFLHEAYAVSARANQRSLDDILAEYQAVRQATLSLFKSFDATVLTRTARCNNQLTSCRALVYDIAGHELHHLYSMQENYG